MSHSVYISTIEDRAGKSLIALGVMDMLLRKSGKIAYFRPIIQAKAGSVDYHAELIINYFDLDQDYDSAYAFFADEASEMLGSGRFDELIDRIIASYKELESEYDYVLIEGTDFVGDQAAFEFEMNAVIARNLGSPVLLVGSGMNKTPEEASGSMKYALDAFHKEECEVIGAIVNRVDNKCIDQCREHLRKRLGGTGKKKEMAVIPDHPMLSSPSIAEIVEELDGKVMFGDDLVHKKLAYSYTVAGMSLSNFLTFIQSDTVVVTAADRSEIILGTLQAHQSKNYPRISGIVLTGGFELPESVSQLLQGLRELVPIVTVQPDTYTTAIALHDVKSNLSLHNPDKIKLALKYFQSQIDSTNLESRIASFVPQGMTPKMFLYNLVQTAGKNKMHIVLPEGRDERILRATANLIEQDLVDITLLHRDVAAVKQTITDLGLHIDLDKVNIIAPRDSPNFEKYASQLYEYRKAKGVNMQMAEDLMSDTSYFGTMMVQLGDADGMVSGAVNTTQHTIRPALQFVKTKPGFNVVSSVFFMCLENRVVVYGDCAINPNPNADQLAEIAVSSANTAKAFGIEPRVAMLSYSSGSSGKGQDVERVMDATEKARAMAPELLIEGPIQYDAAVNPDVASKKLPNSQVAGRATVLIFPDLNTGNNTYKAVQRETNTIAVGPVLQGLNKPVNDLSRGCTVEDIFNTVVITAIQAQNSQR